MSIPLTGVKRMKRVIQIIAILAVCVVVIAGCSSEASEQEVDTNVADSTAHTVKVEQVAVVQISEPLEQVANVVASAQVDIVAKAGADVIEILKVRGDQVVEGDVIIALDDTDARLQREQASLVRASAEQSLISGKKQWQNSVAKLEQIVSDATKMYNKAKNDYDLGLVDKTALDQAESAYTNAKNELTLLKETSVSGLELQLQSAAVSMEMSDRALANHDIKAPINGILTNLDVQEGMTINPGFGIGQIQQLDPIKIKALLTMPLAEKVRGKSQLEFYVPGSGKMLTGEITYISNVIDTQTGTYELNLSIANPDLALKPGMNVQVRLTDEVDQQVVAVPTLSIVREGTDSYVFVLVNNKAEKRKVELGRLKDLNQEVISGLKAGEQLIVSGQHQLKEGDQVEVKK